MTTKKVEEDASSILLACHNSRRWMPTISPSSSAAPARERASVLFGSLVMGLPLGNSIDAFRRTEENQ